MKRLKNWVGFLLAGFFLGGCETPHFQTMTILDSPNRVVALRAIPDAYGGKGYDHPVTFKEEDMVKLLGGVRAQRGLVDRRVSPAFSDTEIRLFAPHFVKAFQKATKEEMVTFFETGQFDPENDLTTSGGLYVAGGNLYVVLSNFSVKTRAWQSAEYHEASYRNRPLDQIDPQSGRLLFDPRQFMVNSPDGEIGSRLKGKPWQVAIRYQEFLGQNELQPRE